MSQIDPSPLASYNSLQDKHLVGYFNNTRMKRHLRRSGLITKRGEIVSESTYRLNSARKEHKKHIKDLMAQAIVHRALDMERHRQVDIKKKLEEIAKIELVRRVKAERQRKGDEDLLPLLSPRLQSSHMMTSIPLSTSRNMRPKSAHPHRARTMVSPGKPRPLTAPGGQSQGSLPVAFDEDGYPVQGTAQQTKENLFSQEEIDTQYLTGLDPVALRQFSVNMADFEPGIGGSGSPYHTVMVPQPPSPRSPKGQKTRHAMVTKDGKIARPHTNKGSLILHRKEPAYPHATQSQSMSDVSVLYRGKYIHLPCDLEDDREEIIVTQQHCGGENLTIFKGLVRTGDTMIFTSRRHRGYPFSLTFFINGIQEMRISTCCESKYKPGSKLKGQQASFTYLGVQGAEKCYRCVIEDEMKQKNKNKKKSSRSKKSTEEKGTSENNNVNTTKEVNADENEGTQVITYDDDDFEEDDEGKKNSPEDIKSYDEERGEYDEDEFEEDNISDAEAPKEPNVIISRAHVNDSSEETYEKSKTDEKEDIELSDSDANESETKGVGIESDTSDTAKSVIKENETSHTATDSEKSDIEDKVGESEEEMKSFRSEDNKSIDYEYSEDEFEKEEEMEEKIKEEKLVKAENEKEEEEKNYEEDGDNTNNVKSGKEPEYNNNRDVTEEEIAHHEKEPEYNNNQVITGEEIAQGQETKEKEIEVFKKPLNENISVESNKETKDQSEDSSSSSNLDKDAIPSDQDSAKLYMNKRESIDENNEPVFVSGNEAKDSESEDKTVSESSSAVLDTMAASMVSSALESACQKLDIDVSKSAECPIEKSLTKSEQDDYDTLANHGNQSVNDDDKLQESKSPLTTATTRNNETDADEEDENILAKQSGTEPESESSLAGDESAYSHTTNSQSETEMEDSDTRGSRSDKEKTSHLSSSGEGITTSDTSSVSSNSSSSESDSEPESDYAYHHQQQSDTPKNVDDELVFQGKQEINLKNMNLTSEIILKSLNLDLVEDNVKILDLSNNKIDDSGARHIADLISRKLKNSLEKLSMAGNPITSEGVAHIVAAIVESSPSPTKLKSLDLGNCIDDIAGAEAVSRLLSHHTSIESLNLAANRNIPLKGWVMISRALQNNSQLKSLELTNTGLGNQGFAILGKALIDNESLQVLNIEGNNIQEEPDGGQILLELVKENSTLTSIHASTGNNISAATLIQVNRILETGSYTEDDEDD